VYGNKNGKICKRNIHVNGLDGWMDGWLNKNSKFD
jgi:hypothetical protein